MIFLKLAQRVCVNDQKKPFLQVLNPVSSDFLDYADADYAALYAEGPISYKKASEAQATLK